MAATLLALKRGDLLPIVQITCTNADGSVVDLTKATSLTFEMRQGPSTAVVSGTATVVAGTLNVAKYVWQGADTAVVGDYIGVIVATFPTSEPQTFPGDGYLLIRIEPAVTDVPVFGASAPPAYAPVAVFKAYPGFANLRNLVPGKDQAHQDAELANMLARASSEMDGFMARSFIAHSSWQADYLLVDQNFESLLVPIERPYVRATALTCVPVPGPGNPVVTLDPTLVYPTYIGRVPTLHMPVAGGGVQPGNRMLTTITFDCGYPVTSMSAGSVNDNTVTVANPLGFVPGLNFRIGDPGQEEYLTVGPSYVIGSASVPITRGLTFAHTAGTAVSAVPPDLEEACILWTLGRLPMAPGKSESSNAPVPQTSGSKKKAAAPTDYIAQAKAIICRGGYRRVM